MIAAGRIAAPHPKKSERPRYANGRAKPPTANERVVANRRLLLDDPQAKGAGLRYAENALDLMLARGWLTQPLLEAATAIRRLYLAALPPLPDLNTTSIAEAPGRDHQDERARAAPRSLPNPDGNPAAMDTLRDIWRVLRVKPAARGEVIELCLLAGSWPTWLLAMIERRCLTGPEREARAAFYWGLHNINAVLARPSRNHDRNSDESIRQQPPIHDGPRPEGQPRPQPSPGLAPLLRQGEAPQRRLDGVGPPERQGSGEIAA